MIDRELHERLRERFNPDGSQLRRQQLRMLDMLKTFDAFCRRHGIRYWLSSGTCLGAIRHEGFIPWDDDLDVEMLRDDYRLLLRHRAELAELGIPLQDHSSDEEYIAPYPKLRDLRSELKEIHSNDRWYAMKGIYIDVFVRERVSRFSARLSHILQYGSYRITRQSDRRVRSFMKGAVYHAMHGVIFPLLRACDRVAASSAVVRHCKGSGFYSELSLSQIFPLSEALFEGHRFPVVHGADAYLRSCYGDYMRLPQLDNIHPHYSELTIY